MLVILLSLALRVLLIGLAPFTDEGCYISASYFAAFHQTIEPGATTVLPNHDKLLLYPTLLFWLNYIPGPPFLYWRLIDALMAAAASATLFLLLHHFIKRTIPAFIGAAAWCLAFNHTVFINAGFKNQIGIASLFLLLGMCAIIMGDGSKKAYLCGGLITLSVLLRETFVGYSIVASVYIWKVHGEKKFIEYSLGVIATGLSVLTVFAMLRGGPFEGIMNVISGYRDYAKMNSHLLKVSGGGDAWESDAAASFKLLLWMFPIITTGVFASFSTKMRDLRNLAFLALGFIFPPLIEIFTIGSFPYRFSQFCLGGAIFAAIGVDFLMRLLEIEKFRKTGIAAMFVLFVFFMSGSQEYWRTTWNAWKESLYFSSVMVKGDWSSPVVADSFYLDAARKIKGAIPVNGRVLVSGFYHGLYPLAGRLPYSLEISDVSSYMMINNGSTDRLTEMFLKKKPDMIIETNRFKKSLSLKEKWPEFTNYYRLSDAVPEGKRSYGNFAAQLWRLNIDEIEK